METDTLPRCHLAGPTLTNAIAIVDEAVGIDAALEIARHHDLCFGCGRDVPGGLRMELSRYVDGSVAGLVTLRRELQGPPGVAHGGLVACVLDEAASLAATSLEMVTLTSSLEIRLRRATPVGVPLWVEARVEWADAGAAEVLAVLASREQEILYASCRAKLVNDRRGAGPTAV